MTEQNLEKRASSIQEQARKIAKSAGRFTFEAFGPVAGTLTALFAPSYDIQTEVQKALSGAEISGPMVRTALAFDPNCNNRFEITGPAGTIIYFHDPSGRNKNEVVRTATLSQNGTATVEMPVRPSDATDRAGKDAKKWTTKTNSDNREVPAYGYCDTTTNISASDKGQKSENQTPAKPTATPQIAPTPKPSSNMPPAPEGGRIPGLTSNPTYDELHTNVRRLQEQLKEATDAERSAQNWAFWGWVLAVAGAGVAIWAVTDRHRIAGQVETANTQRDNALISRTNALNERTAALAERNAANTARDNAITARDQAIAQRNTMETQLTNEQTARTAAENAYQQMRTDAHQLADNIDAAINAPGATPTNRLITAQHEVDAFNAAHPHP